MAIRMRQFGRALARRLSQPSTYASITALLAMLGLNVDQEWVHVATLIGGGIAGALGIILNEKAR